MTKKRMNRRVWLIFSIFLAIRLLLVFHIPIFNDESIYLRWGIGFLQHPDRWWAWTLDGKQPAVAITFGLSQLLPFDPIISMRLVSILWSVVTFWMVFLFLSSPTRSGIGFGIQNTNTDSRLRGNDKRVEYALLLLTFCPFLILFDTLALAESAVTATFAVSLYFTLSLLDKPKLWKLLTLGPVIALGWWFKSTVLLIVPMVCLTALLTWRVWKGRWYIVVLGLAVGALVGFLMVTPVLFNPNIDYSKTAVITRTSTIAQIVHVPLARWIGLSEVTGMWFGGFGGVLLVVAFFIGAWRLRKDPITQILFLWVVMPVAAEVMFLTSLSARLMAFAMVPLILLAARWMESLRNRTHVFLIVGSVAAAGILLSFSPLSFYRLLTPLSAAQGDFGQYITNWTSGWGITDAVNLLINESKNGPIIVFVRLDSGNPEDAVIAYMERNRIPVFYVEQLPQVEHVPGALSRQWYFVSRGKQLAGLDGHLTQVAVFNKPLDDEFVGVYRINK